MIRILGFAVNLVLVVLFKGTTFTSDTEKSHQLDSKQVVGFVRRIASRRARRAERAAARALAQCAQPPC